MFDDFFNKIPEKSCKKSNLNVYYRSAKKKKIKQKKKQKE